MGSVCFSSASILRCASLDRIQNIVIFIPTALEVVFSFSLIFVKWNMGWQHLFLTAEGLTYFALAGVELLSHTLPAARESVNVYRVFDTFLGVSSFLPLLCYTVFLYLFARSELLCNLPRRIRSISKPLFLNFIPAIIVFNAVASFVGVSVRNIKYQNVTIPAIGFNNRREEVIWSFFTSFTLALVAAFQAGMFCFAFYRLIQAVISQRRIETDATDAAHMFKGIGWINAGLKLGAIETTVGFAGGGFGISFTRRILRFLSRAFLCIGLAKGVDEIEDFRVVRNEMNESANRRGNRRSRLRQLISNPRLSTFRHLSPTATNFPGGYSSTSEKPRQRVTVSFHDGTPKLEMRFSELSIPSIVGTPERAWIPPRRISYRTSSTYSPSFMGPAEIVTAPQRTLSQKSARAKVVRGLSQTTMKSEAMMVREIASQFPLTTQNQTMLGVSRDIDLDTIPPSAASSEGFPDRITREEAAQGDPFNERRSSLSMSLPTTASRIDDRDPFEDVEDRVADLLIDRFNRNPAGKLYGDVGSSTSSEGTPFTMKSMYSQAFRTSSTTSYDDQEDQDQLLDLASVLTSNQGKERTRASNRSVTRTGDWMGYSYTQRRPSIIERPLKSARSSTARSNTDSMDARAKTMEELAIPWLEKPDPEAEEEVISREISRQREIARIKSVGKAPHRLTPTPTHTTGIMRASTHLEPIIIPPRTSGKTEIIQGSLSSAYSGRGVLRDSEVLGIEDGSIVRNIKTGYHSDI